MQSHGPFDLALVVEDLEESRRWLVDLLPEALPTLRRVDAAASVGEAREFMHANRYRLAIVDWGLPDGTGEEVIRDLIAATPDAVVIVATIHDDDAHVFPALRAGAAGYVLKSRPREEVVSQLANYFAVLAIFISCLGLFGLATFTAGQRTKEIGVRKVLGATASSVVGLLSKDFLKPLLIAITIATPLAWFVMNRWLSNYAYKIHLDWWIFALAGLLAVCIAMLTVSYQSIKSALMNPVTSLREN